MTTVLTFVSTIVPVVILLTFWLVLRLHSFIKAEDKPQSFYAAVKSLMSADIKGPNDLRIDEDFAEFIKRDKNKILIEEEMRTR